MQARDTDADKIDTNDTGNRVAKFDAPSSPSVTSAPILRLRGLRGRGRNTRFTPPLVENAGRSGRAQDDVPNFQRVTGVQVSTGSEQAVVSSMMYAPDLNAPGGEAAGNCGGTGGAASDFSTTVGPLTLTPTSVLEFDHFFITEAAFDAASSRSRSAATPLSTRRPTRTT